MKNCASVELLGKVQSVNEMLASSHVFLPHCSETNDIKLCQVYGNKGVAGYRLNKLLLIHWLQQ
jgi:hypothetical protein